MLKVILWSAILLFVVSNDAQAYIDPGSGHFLLQLVMAAFIGGLFYVKKAVAFLRKPWRSKQKPEAIDGLKAKKEAALPSASMKPQRAS